MDGLRSRPRTSSRLLLFVVLVTVPLAFLGVRFLEVPRDRVTVSAVVIGILLVTAALALPALILSGWQSERESE